MTIKLLHGDCRDVLKTLPDASVHCCVTSPPYFGLRDYGTAQWKGGAANCVHSVGGQVQDSKAPGAITTGVRPGVDASRCRKCGAERVDSQIGIEQTPDAYVAELVAVFREVRRVLRADGTLWLNLGDSYASNPASGGQQSTAMTGGEHKRTPGSRPYRRPDGLKPKDLIGIPWRVAFALQADGWYLRQDIIWHKPNPMPESVRDRCTKAHEYLFLLSKSERYYFDSAMMQEPAVATEIGAMDGGAQRMPDGSNANDGRNFRASRSGNKERKPASARGVPVDDGGKTVGAVAGSVPWEGFTRNKRSVWTVTTQPFKEAHFATFPPALIEPCIAAGCPEGGTVLDPFGGAGTTGLVADRMQRNAVLIELNAEYAAISERRITADAPLFASVEVAA